MTSKIKKIEQRMLQIMAIIMPEKSGDSSKC